LQFWRILIFNNFAPKCFYPGTKKVVARVQSKNALTHSYTIQPIISAEGRLLSPLYVVLQEANGQFGPNVQRTMLKPINLFVEASKSGKTL